MRPLILQPTAVLPTSVWTAYAKSMGVAPRGKAMSRPLGVKQKTWSWNSSSFVCSRNSSGLSPSARRSMVRRSHW